MAEARTVAISEPLCFIRNRISKLTFNEIKQILTDFYNVDQLTVSKKRLADDIERLCIDGWRRPPSRLDGVNKVKNEVEDLLQMFTFVDEKGRMDDLPIYVCEDVDRLPTARWSDGEFKMLIEKLNKVQLENIELRKEINTILFVHSEKVNSVISDTFADLSAWRKSIDTKLDILNDRFGAWSCGQEAGIVAERYLISHDSREPAIHSEINFAEHSQSGDQHSHQVQNESTNDVSTDDHSMQTAGEGHRVPSYSAILTATGPVNGSAIQGRVMTSNRSTRGGAVALSNRYAALGHFQQRTLSTTEMGDTGESAASDMEVAQDGEGGPFTMVKRREKRRRTTQSPSDVDASRAQGQGQGCMERQGQSTTGLSSLSGPRPKIIGNKYSSSCKIKASRLFLEKSVYAVSNVSPDCSVDDIVEYVKESGIEIINCFSATTKFNGTKCFRVCIAAKDAARFVDPANWPNSVIVRPWFHKPKQLAQHDGVF
jgi:hypothetical protein